MAAPDSIPDLSGWWDAGDNATITENPAGFCESIDNKQASVTAPKTYQQLLAGQKPAVVMVDGFQGLLFDGSNDYLQDVQSNSVLQPGAGDFTLFAMCLIDPAVQEFSGMWTQRDGPGVESWGLQGRAGIDFTARDSAGDLGQLTATDETFDDGTTIWVVIAVSEGDDMNLYYGSAGTGALIASSAGPVDRSAVGDVDAVNSAIGNLPDTQPVFGWWEGTLFKWGAYKRALTAGQRTTLFEGLLGISSDVPFGDTAVPVPASAALLSVPVQNATGAVTTGPGSTRSRSRYFESRLDQ